MASEPAATAAPVFTTPAKPTATAGNLPDTTPARTKSLKRTRQDRSSSPSSRPMTHNQLRLSPAPKSPRFGEKFMAPYQPIALTGAAALEDERRRHDEAQKAQDAGISENPSHRAMTALMAGGGVAMSKAQNPSDPATSMSQGMSVAASAMNVPSSKPSDEQAEISPASVTSLASLGSTAPTATANYTAVATPTEMSGAVEGESRDARPAGFGQLQAPTGEQGRGGSSYPPPFHGHPDPASLPTRGMSLPMPGQSQQLAPRSPSLKKHKCPYCETDFTRHHNLKSHLLTHSQEKPYLCQTCNMRFRRLHDLKRHMKLHSGERPHICPKCKRKFARGDALARHSKGQGGCAGRRASMGDFGGEDEYEGSNAGERAEEGMDGVMYTNGTPGGNEADMTEEDRRRLSLPSIKAQHVASNHASQDSYSSHSRGPSTYPPAGPRPGQSPGGLYPPTAGGSSSSSGSASMQNSHTSHMSISQMPKPASGPILPQGGMTESPKPLSPSGMHGPQLGHDSIHRQRSPSLTTQFQQAHFGRRQSGRGSPPVMSLPSPHSTSHGPKLPAIAGLAPDSRYATTTQSTSLGNGSGHSSTVHSPNAMFQPSLGPRTHQLGENADNSNNLFAGGDRVWQYVASLEEKVKQLSEKMQAMEQKEKNLEEKLQEERINRLAEENASLRSQLNAAQRQPSHQPSFGQS